ncbi:uncharacterized protein A4U43_C01F24180 [Asparagus officinalis]|uniref:Uncharacterized protein n=1 Tax=Asparagus officinalis TaxID=4686 RepID=A0A5P1FVY9_ASPOF|nr:uncharacterized protein A4U43_C01F24180 [Asparagus officinalis]
MLESPVKEKSPEAPTHGPLAKQATILGEEERVNYDTDANITDPDKSGLGDGTDGSSHIRDDEPEPGVDMTMTFVSTPIVESSILIEDLSMPKSARHAMTSNLPKEAKPRVKLGA